MTDITHNGWTLVTDEDQDSDGFYRYDHYAVHSDGRRQHLHGSPYLTSFNPTPARFAWLVDHDFPRAWKGNWFSYEIDEFIKGEHNGSDTTAADDDTAAKEGVVPTEDNGTAVLRDLPE